ncbi:hypothetical protein GLAREA_05363 [Glarea lozoyensis ATCC 20868]|uniref:Nineteen complex-related protein 2 n=1 Tax=Glarea lozoyensis (strain ATCC 20868 / MF5171) TaxID=1116229 RepID=S3DE41_GLAL2|nr:uncharacterized protein GLAREA_05363 [Glarea lozoyensis ATCC 20868]EPE36025.1 hypothetical protein GLAREA_05363 [Glarea lozoyensis ATCC 20868]
MKSAFGSKRKARKIQVEDDEEDQGAKNSESVQDESVSSTPIVVNLSRKGFKKSGLRQSIAFDDLEHADEQTRGSGNEGAQNPNKPTIGRSNSLMKKKKKATSRLSFGPGEIISGDAAAALEDDEAFTPKKPTLGRRVVEGNALRTTIPFPNRPGDDDEERPTYSKDYLNELKSSTPNRPTEIQDYQATAEDEEGLDASELEGATVIDLDAPVAHIPTDAEIREKKERRARLAHEKDFISLNDSGDDRRQLSLLPRKKTETRLVRDDEDIAEGFDEFVDDGRIALGKKQEREARRKHRKEIADMIYKAEGSEEGDSDDSEEERNAAYEAAQTRAGMDGLHRPDEEEKAAAAQVPPKITPLPVLTECLVRLQSTLSAMQQELANKHQKVARLEKEKTEILAREAEVQELLKQSGERFAALKADSNGAVADPSALVEAAKRDGTTKMEVDRGLESFGNTPTVRPNIEDVG